VPDRFASTAARELAHELGLGEVEIIGSGRGGRVTLADVRNAAPQVPAGLADDGAALWRDVLADLDTQGLELRPDRQRILYAACRTLDEITRLEIALDAASVTVPGSKGQVRGHPLIRELRDHRLAYQRLLDALELTDEHVAGSRGRSDAGRRLANQRWARRRG
jgi:hypothetical protein